MHGNIKFFILISACNVSSHRLPSQTVVNIGLAAGDPGSSTHPLSFVKVSDLFGPTNLQILKFVKPNCRLQTTTNVQKFSVRFHPPGLFLD